MAAQDAAQDPARDDGAQDDGADVLDRLDQALSRIEAAAHPAVPAEAVARLDAVIARLRAGLEG